MHKTIRIVNSETQQDESIQVRSELLNQCQTILDYQELYDQEFTDEITIHSSYLTPTDLRLFLDLVDKIDPKQDSSLVIAMLALIRSFMISSHLGHTSTECFVAAFLILVRTNLQADTPVSTRCIHPLIPYPIQSQLDRLYLQNWRISQVKKFNFDAHDEGRTIKLKMNGRYVIYNQNMYYDILNNQINYLADYVDVDFTKIGPKLVIRNHLGPYQQFTILDNELVKLAPQPDFEEEILNRRKLYLPHLNRAIYLKYYAIDVWNLKTQHKINSIDFDVGHNYRILGIFNHYVMCRVGYFFILINVTSGTIAWQTDPIMNILAACFQDGRLYFFDPKDTLTLQVYDFHQTPENPKNLSIVPLFAPQINVGRENKLKLKVYYMQIYVLFKVRDQVHILYYADLKKILQDVNKQIRVRFDLLLRLGMFDVQDWHMYSLDKMLLIDKRANLIQLETY